MNDNSTDTHNPTFDLIIKYTHHNNTYPKGALPPKFTPHSITQPPSLSHRIPHDPSYTSTMTLNVSPHRTAVQEQHSIVEENIHKKAHKHPSTHYKEKYYN
jgi:hypothetical protein